jgi:TM2 domain-containing membrane protein YozV
MTQGKNRANSRSARGRGNRWQWWATNTSQEQPPGTNGWQTKELPAQIADPGAVRSNPGAIRKLPGGAHAEHCHTGPITPSISKSTQGKSMSMQEQSPRAVAVLQCSWVSWMILGYDMFVLGCSRLLRNASGATGCTWLLLACSGLFLLLPVYSVCSSMLIAAIYVPGRSWVDPGFSFLLCLVTPGYS